MSIRSRGALAVLFCSYVVAFLDRGLVSVAAAPLKQDLSLTDTQFGVLNGTAFVALYCLCGIPLGWLADRTDRRMMIAAGLLLWSTMTAACAMAHSFPGFCMARLGVGLGEACLVPAGISLLASVTPGSRLAGAVAVFLMGAAFGNAVALLAGGHILEHIESIRPYLPGLDHVASWRVLFLLAALPGIAIAPLLLRIREPARAAPSGNPLRALRDVLAQLAAGTAAYGFSTAATACIIILSQTQAAWMPLFYSRAFGLAPGQSALTVGVLFLISAPTGQWVGGRLIDHLRARGLIAAPHIVQASCALLCIPAAVAFCTSLRLQHSESAYGIFNFLVFAATPAGLTGWNLLTPERSKALMISLLIAVVTLIGVGAGPLAVGLLTDRFFGTEAALGMSLLIVICFAGIVGCSTALLGARAYTEAISSGERPDNDVTSGASNEAWSRTSMIP